MWMGLSAAMAIVTIAAARLPCNFDFRSRFRRMHCRTNTVNGGHVKAENSNGDYKVHNVNGSIELLEMAGSGDATTVNGAVKVTFRENPRSLLLVQERERRTCSLVSPRPHRRLQMQDLNGGVYTDFEATGCPCKRPRRKDKGRNTSTRATIQQYSDWRRRSRAQIRHIERQYQNHQTRLTVSMKSVIAFKCSINRVRCSAWGPGSEAAGTGSLPIQRSFAAKMVKASVINGSITVKGYDGKDVLIEGRSHEGRRNIRRGPKECTASIQALSGLPRKSRTTPSASARAQQ